jgi:hypothetical protein
MSKQNPFEIRLKIDPTKDVATAMWTIKVEGGSNLSLNIYTAKIQMSDYVIENAFNGDETEALRVSMRQGIDAVLGKIFEKKKPRNKTFVFR